MNLNPLTITLCGYIETIKISNKKLLFFAIDINSAI
jgi:hypothetical protein